MKRCAYDNRMHTITVRLPEPLWAKLAAKASRANASVNWLVTEWIAAGLLDSPLQASAKPADALPWLED